MDGRFLSHYNIQKAIMSVHNKMNGVKAAEVKLDPQVCWDRLMTGLRGVKDRRAAARMYLLATTLRDHMRAGQEALAWSTWRGVEWELTHMGDKDAATDLFELFSQVCESLSP